jgi:hypothetical protein
MSYDSRTKGGRVANGKAIHQAMPSLAEQFLELEHLREEVRKAELRNARRTGLQGRRIIQTSQPPAAFARTARDPGIARPSRYR